jgi:putative nucleotidyltransferase with HDIG domain
MTTNRPGEPDPIFSRLVDTVSQIAGQGTVYLVGGAVRDLLMRRPCHDLDFSLDGNVKSLARKSADALRGDFFMLDEERSTARVIYYNPIAGRIFLDFALLRGATIEDDLRARDFTVNALALDLKNLQAVIDPLGGVQDLAAKRLRPASPGAFKNDPVRVLRGVRQSLALAFLLEPPTLQAMQAAAPLLRTVSTERQRDELFNMLEGSQVDAAVRMLDQIGALGLILPELEQMKGVAQSAPHIYDVWEHTLVLLAQLAALLDALATPAPSIGEANPLLETAMEKLGRFRHYLADHLNDALNPNRSLRGLLFLAALYHDIAKPQTRQDAEGGRTHFIGHETAGARIAARRAQQLALSQAEVQRLEAIVAGHMRIHLLAQSGLAPSRRAIYRFFRRTGAAGVDICLLSLADTLATYGPSLPPENWLSELEICRSLLEAWWEHPAKTVSPPRLVTGDDLLAAFNLPPGPKIGELLAAIQEAQACGEVTDHQQALEFAVKYLKGWRNDSLTG